MALDSRVETTEVGSAAFSFEGGSGALVSVRNRVTGNECLQGPVQRGNVFAVYYDFSGEFEITGSERESPHAASLPAAITKGVFSPLQARSPRFVRGGSGDAGTLTVEYECGDAAAPLRASLGVGPGPDADSSIWSLALTNTGAAPVTCMGSFPLFSGLRLGSGEGNLMVVNDQAGYVLPLWAHSGGTYGNARYMSMQWGCVFDERSRDAFGFIVRDPEIRNKQIRYLKPSIEVSYFPPFSIAPGETVTFPEVEIMVYAGDWKRAAQRYRAWFSRHVGTTPHAGWAQRIDGYAGGWFEKRGQTNPEGYPHVMLPLDRFEDLPGLYHAVPVDCQEYAFHCSRSQPAEVTGKRMLWTDADNVIRGDLGGAPALREGIRRIHELGYHFTFYVEGYLCPGDAEIVLHRGAREWAVTNRDGSNRGAYTREGEELGCGLLHMCTGCAEWQEHLARTAARLVRETGADGVRLDSLGFYGYPCYHPGHRHESPFDYNRWLQQMLEKVAAAVRRENPDCLLTTEGGADFFGRHFDGALTQQFIPERVAVSRDVSPMRIAVPEYLVLWHVTSGPVAASLSGYPGGSASNISTTPRFMELDRKWRCARYPVADVIRWGNAVHDNPAADRADVTCRRFSSDTLDVIVGARPRFRNDWEQGTDPADSVRRGVAMNAEVDLMRDRVSYRVTVETPGRRPRSAVLFDIERQRVTEVEVSADERAATFEVDCNWFLAVLRYEASPPLAVLDLPARRPRGAVVAATVSLHGGTPAQSCSGMLSAPSLGLSEPRQVTVPGRFELPIPETAASGFHRIRLTSEEFRGCERFLEVAWT